MDIFRNARQNFLRREQAEEAADLERQQVREEHQQPGPQPATAESPRQEMQQRSPGSSILQRFADLHRPTMPAFVSRRWSRNAAPQPRPSSSRYDDDDEEEEREDEFGQEGEIVSPKTPRFSLNMPNLPSTRLHLPNLQRTWTQGSNGPPSRPGTAPSQPQPLGAGIHPALRTLGGQRAQPEVLMDPLPAMPAAHVRGEERTRSGPRRFNGADPAELQLASMANDGRRRRHRARSGSDRAHRRNGSGSGSASGNGSGSGSGSRTGTSSGNGTGQRRRRHRARDGNSGSSQKAPPKRFLFCFPWVKSRRIRSRILQCFVSGLLLTLLLAVYLALSITKNINNSEFTVMLILIILFTTIFFCHGLIRLCMLIVKKPGTEERQRRERTRLPNMYGPGGYAIPEEPIRVVLARDEEAAGIESEATKSKPPAYGLWRESVRVDPNRIYWQRNEEAPPLSSDSVAEEPEDGESLSRTDSQRQASRGTGGPLRRPPSYASDDGVGYVVDAQPRSIAPTSEVLLPQHPAEAGRLGSPPEW